MEKRLIRKIKIKSFSLGVSGDIFSGIVIGYIVTNWAHGAVEGGAGFSDAKRIFSTGVVAQAETERCFSFKER